MRGGGAALCVWQRDDGLCAAVLHEVFSWLSAAEVCCARRVCVAWRCAGSTPSLWRALLRRSASLTPLQLDALAAHKVCWEKEYIATFGGFDEESVVEECGAGCAMFAAVEEGAGGRVAVMREGGALEVWARGAGGAWATRARWAPAGRGWARALRCHWPPAPRDPRTPTRADRLLLVGELALVHAWELLVIQFDEEGVSGVCSRARCSPGAGGCWADAEGSAYLSLELRVFAPRLAATTVWLNAATQETQSEYAGVVEPALRVYNELGEHYTTAVVVQVPLEPRLAPPPARADADDIPAYYQATLSKVSNVPVVCLLIMTVGCREAGGVYAWAVGSVRVPALCARGGLSERVSARGGRAPPAPTPDEAPPSEREVRALCSAPLASHALLSPPLGAAPHHSGRCVWLSLRDGDALCLSLPTLDRLRLLSPGHAALSRHTFSSHFMHYIQPAVSRQYVLIPRPEGLCVWSAVSGARAAAPPHAASAGAAPSDSRLLLLTADKLYVFKSRAA